MKQAAVLILALVAILATAPAAHALTCAQGVYHAGCAGRNGAAVVKKPPVAAAPKCAAGVYRAGCVGPNGAAIVRRP